MPRDNASTNPDARRAPRTLAQRDLEVLWHPCAQMRDYRVFAPLHIVDARGVTLTLADGRTVYDAVSSWWCKSLGHGHPRVRAAMREQLERFEHVLLANTTNDAVVRLCERLLEVCNGGAEGPLRKVFFADNGSTAVEVAMKMAVHAQAHRGRPERARFVALSNGYHGETVGAMSVSDLDWAASPYRGMCMDVTRLTGLPYRSGPGDARWMEIEDEWPAIEAQLEAVAGEACAVVYEPVLQAAGCMRLYSPALLPRLRAWADAHGVYLIADEIAAGMGRLGHALASHLGGSGRVAECPSGRVGSVVHASSTTRPLGHSDTGACLPDFAVVSKGLTAGAAPMACVLTTDAVYDLFDSDYGEGKQFMHSNTFAGYALAVAAANAALDVFEADGVFAGVRERGPGLVARFEALAKDRPGVCNVRGCGFVAALDLCAPDGSALDPATRTGYAVYRAAVERGALFRNLGDTMYLFPPLTTTGGELDAMVAVLADAVDAVCR